MHSCFEIKWLSFVRGLDKMGSTASAWSRSRLKHWPAPQPYPKSFPASIMDMDSSVEPSHVDLVENSFCSRMVGEVSRNDEQNQKRGGDTARAQDGIRSEREGKRGVRRGHDGVRRAVRGEYAGVQSIYLADGEQKWVNFYPRPPPPHLCKEYSWHAGNFDATQDTDLFYRHKIFNPYFLWFEPIQTPESGLIQLSKSIFSTLERCKIQSD